MLPLIKITDLLKEVDQWTNFTDEFIHLKSGNKVEDKNLLLTVILSDAINLGLRKMSEASPGTSYAKLSWLQAWHIRDDTYSLALAKIINKQTQHHFSSYWGEGKHLLQMVNVLLQVAMRKGQVLLTLNMEVLQEFSFIHTFLINMLHFILKLLM